MKYVQNCKIFKILPTLSVNGGVNDKIGFGLNLSMNEGVTTEPPKKWKNKIKKNKIMDHENSFEAALYSGFYVLFLWF